MNRVLFQKEIRYLAPVAVFFFLLLCLELFSMPLSSPMLESHWYQMHPSLEDSDIIGVVVYFFGFVMAYSLFPREYEERTIDFLHTLPVTRRQIFWSKTSAAFVLIFLVLFSYELCYALVQLFNHNSFGRESYSFAVSWRLVFKNSCLGVVGLSHGLLLSPARHLGVLLLFVSKWGIGRVQARYPYMTYLSPFSLSSNEFSGTELVLPWKAIGVQLAVAAIALLLAERIWSTRGHQSTTFVLVKLKKQAFLVGCGTVFVALFLFIAWALEIEDPEDEEESPVRYVSRQTAKLETEYYHFTYPSSHREPALGLARRADKIFETTFEYLGDPKSDQVIVADLTDVSEEHLGIATQGKLRMDLTRSEEPGKLDHILCHETCHVLAYRLSGRRGQGYSNLLSVFHEGTAGYYAYQLTESSFKLEDSRRLALALYLRHDLEFKELFDALELEKHLSQGAKYALGELWLAALVDCYGKDAPARVWRAVNRDARDDLQGEVFWRDTFQAAGLSLDRVSAAWYKRLKSLEKTEAAFLETLPKLSIRAERQDEDVVLVVKTDRPIPENWPGLLVWVRKPDTDARTLWISERRSQSTTVIVPEFFGDTFDYQVGIEFSEDAYSFVNEWRQAKGI